MDHKPTNGNTENINEILHDFDSGMHPVFLPP